jgi:chromosomal replication initiator protein
MAVANKPGGTSFNPLLIFGGVGLGKTLSTRYWSWDQDKHPEKTVLYISARNIHYDCKKNNRNDFIHFIN